MRRGVLLDSFFNHTFYYTFMYLIHEYDMYEHVRHNRLRYFCVPFLLISPVPPRPSRGEREETLESTQKYRVPGLVPAVLLCTRV